VNAGFESHIRDRYSSRRAATHSFSASSMRVCQPSPVDLK
jgi:hypothetical protein